MHGHRSIPSVEGRYLSPDPIGIWGDITSGLISGPNSFSYAGQNPANLIDPLGQDAYVFTGEQLCNPKAITPAQLATINDVLDHIQGPLGDKARKAFQQALKNGTIGLAPSGPPKPKATPQFNYNH